MHIATFVLGIWWSLALAQQNIPWFLETTPTTKKGRWYLSREGFVLQQSIVSFRGGKGLHPHHFFEPQPVLTEVPGRHHHGSGDRQTVQRQWQGLGDPKKSKKWDSCEMGRISAWNPLFESSINSDVFRLRSLQKWGKVILIDADPLFCIQTRLPLRSVFGCGSLRTQLPAPSRFMLFALKLDSLRIRLWPCPMAFPGKRQHTLRPGGGSVTWSVFFF